MSTAQIEGFTDHVLGAIWAALSRPGCSLYPLADVQDFYCYDGPHRRECVAVLTWSVEARDGAPTAIVLTWRAGEKPPVERLTPKTVGKLGAIVRGWADAVLPERPGAAELLAEARAEA